MEKSFRTSSVFLTLNLKARSLKGRELKKIENSLDNALESCEGFLRDQKVMKDSGEYCVGVDLSVVGVQRITRLNQNYRDKNRKTDVLSFPQFSDLKSLQKSTGAQELLLGDIVICWPVACSQAKEFQIPVEEEFLHLFFHGFLHLLGFDHERSLKEEKVMEKHEQDLVEKTLLRL